MLTVGIKKIFFPCPFHVRKQRALQNTKNVDSLGDSYQLVAVHEVASKSKKKASSENFPLIIKITCRMT